MLLHPDLLSSACLDLNEAAFPWHHPHLCILDLQLDGLLFGLSQLQLPLQQLQTPLSLSHLCKQHRTGQVQQPAQWVRP